MTDDGLSPKLRRALKTLATVADHAEDLCPECVQNPQDCRRDDGCGLCVDCCRKVRERQKERERKRKLRYWHGPNGKCKCHPRGRANPHYDPDVHDVSDEEDDDE